MRYVDHLTSLKNRHYLNQNYLNWQANKIYPQAIIVININKIGHINDVYGHEEGDSVIKKAMNEENVLKHIEGKEVIKQIVVPNKIVNIVVK